jgi:serine/threonine protein kinase
MKNYKTLRKIGKGGMSTVFLARHLSEKQLVAVKILKGATLEDPEYIKRFFREARITAKLSHPNIIRIIESNFSPTEKLFYIVTEYIDGGNFRQLMQKSDETIPLKQKLSVLHKVLMALDYAHKNGIIHRDIKPSNILLTKTLEPKLCDFGIATALWGQETRFTSTGEIMGTMDYIAPEQKESSRNVDARADIYSIGVILYQIVTGRKPLGAFPPPQKIIPQTPDPLDALIMKCLQPIPADRYKNVRNLSEELFRIIRQLDTDLVSLPISSQGAAPQTEKIVIKDIPIDADTLIEKLKNGTIAEKLSVKPRFLEAVKGEHQQKLLELLPQADGFFKEALIEAIGIIKSKKSCGYLIELLNDPYYNKVAAAAIGEIGCIEAEEKLFNLLLTHKQNSHIALIPLGKINSVKSIDLVSQYLSYPQTWIREMALDALALIDDKEGNSNEKIISHLENSSVNDEDANIRARSKKILWRLKQ